jgi:2-methylcitrate dehydratase PrpD/2-keto-3-deoxy-L-rhamnonate aldolase RhmA
VRNRVKRVISEGQMALGGLTGNFGGSTIVELIGVAGLDAALIDLEHNGIDLDEVQAMIIAAEAVDITPIVRVPELDRPLITRLLDMGAQGIQLDGVSSAEQARALVDAMRFPPEGSRGLIWNSRSARFGTVKKSTYAETANREALVKISIDDQPGLDAVEEIAAVDGVDIIGVGAHDLASVLGVVGQPDHPKLVEAIERVIRAVTASGPGRLALPLDSAAYPRTAAQLVELGVAYTNIQPHPEQRLVRGLREQAASVREAAGDLAGRKRAGDPGTGRVVVNGVTVDAQKADSEQAGAEQADVEQADAEQAGSRTVAHGGKVVAAADVRAHLAKASGTTITAEVARHVAALRYEQLPEPVISRAKDIILDALGGQLACSTLPHGKIAIEFARRQAGRPDATVIGTDFKTGVEHAALVNGIQGHGDEIDESLLGFGHASAVLVPTVLAAAEREHASGRDMIVALVAGYDIAARIAKAGFNLDVLAPRNWQQGSTGGSLAAAMAAGKVLGLGEEALRAALGVAAEQACGLQSMRTETGHMHKSLHMGVGARNGLTSAYMAQVGYGGVDNVLEPPYSIFEAFIPGAAKPAEMTSELGTRFDILASRFKRYSSGSPTHSAIASIHEILASEGIEAKDLERIDVGMPTLEHALLSKSLTLNINFEYIIAVAALDGVVTWEQYSEERQQDPVLRDLWQRVRAFGDPELDLLKDANVGARPAEVTLTTRDGRSFRKRMLYPPGHPRNPLSAQELREKFTYWSTRVLTPARSEELRLMIADLDQVDDVNDLGALLRV